MARVELAQVAADDLERLIESHSLPGNARHRVGQILRPLRDFPRLGTRLEGDRWRGHRYLVGPWRWLLTIYEHDEKGDVVVIKAFEDARASDSATTLAAR